MANKYLDLSGLIYFWSQVKPQIEAKADQTVVNTLSQGVDALTTQINNKPWIGDATSIASEAMNAVSTDVAKTYATKAEVSSVFKFKGTQSESIGELPDIMSATPGEVWNIDFSFTTDGNFVEGTGYEYPRGTNIVCIEVSVYDHETSTSSMVNKWDVLSGIYDFSSVDVESITDAEIDNILNPTTTN